MAAAFQTTMFQDQSDVQQEPDTTKATSKPSSKTLKKLEALSPSARNAAPPIPGDDLSVQLQAEALREWVNHHSHNYYNLDRPTTNDSNSTTSSNNASSISNPNTSEARDPNSPTQRVGGVADSQFQQVTHDSPMLSLANLN